MIERLLTADGRVGWDSFDQLVLATPSRNGVVFTHIANTFGMTCAICGRGWDLTGVSLADQLHWSLTDSFVHETCLERHVGLVERSTPTPNQYLRLPASPPWYTAIALDAPLRFVLGRRKRVDHVEVVPEHGEITWAGEAEAAFVGEDVTKNFTASSVLLHAWSETKVREYIATLAKLAGLDRRKP